MKKAILFAPGDRVIDASLDARRYLDRLSERLELDRRLYRELGDGFSLPDGVSSAAVLAGLSELARASGYMEMELDTIFEPQRMLGGLRAAAGPDFPVVAIVDDAYSDYIMSSYLKAGASAVVGTGGALFGVVTDRIRSWDELLPYINAFSSI